MLTFFIAYLREKFPLNRAVPLATAIVTPLAASLGGGVSAWLADHLPLIAEQVGPKQMTAIFVAGATFTATAIVTGLYQWMKGWHLEEARIFKTVNDLTAGAPLTQDDPGDDERRALKDKPGATPQEG